jgi:Ca2+-binding EF-hand superfamily protein
MVDQVCPCLSDDQIRSFIRAFRFTDHDSDGYLTREEFLQALEVVGVVPTESEQISIFEDIPETRITIEDFVAVLYYFLRGNESAEDLSRAFIVFDDNHTGLISVDKATQILKHLKHPVPDSRIAELMERLDPRGEGEIDYREMIGLLVG